MYFFVVSGKAGGGGGRTNTNFLLLSTGVQPIMYISCNAEFLRPYQGEGGGGSSIYSKNY